MNVNAFSGKMILRGEEGGRESISIRITFTHVIRSLKCPDIHSGRASVLVEIQKGGKKRDRAVQLEVRLRCDNSSGKERN